jgi:hypothetical protein
MELTRIDRSYNFVVEFMFRLVNSTKNIKNIFSRTILTSIPINYFSYHFLQLSLSGYQWRNSPYQFTNSGHQLTNSPYQCNNSGHQCINAGHQCRNTGSQCKNAGHQCINAGHQCRNTGSQCRNAGQQCRNAAYQWRNTPYHSEIIASFHTDSKDYQGNETGYRDTYNINLIQNNRSITHI